MAADQNNTLEDIRRRIDEIDDAILALIGERMQAVHDVRAAKAGLDNGQSTAMRPGREAAILRRLVAARGDAVPAGLVVRLWREVIASATRLQGPLPLHVADVNGGSDVSDLAREHFGTGGEMTRHGTASEVIDAVSARVTDVGVIATGSEGVAGWVDHLLSRPDPAPRIIVALPFVSTGGAPKAAVLGHAAIERTGDDCTVVAVRGDVAAVADALVSLREAGQDSVALAQGETWALRAIAGWIEPGDIHFEKLKAAPGVDDVRIVGAYAMPIRVTESE